MHSSCVTQLQNNFISICRNMSKSGLVFYSVSSYGIIGSSLSQSSEDGVHTGFQNSSQRIQGYFRVFFAISCTRKNSTIYAIKQFFWPIYGKPEGWLIDRNNASKIL